MLKLLPSILVAGALMFVADAASAAEPVREARAIDARVVKLSLGGVVNVVVKQGATPSLVLIGMPTDVARVVVQQQGNSLSIDTKRRLGWNNNDNEVVRAELTLPNLEELNSHGVGGTEVAGFTGKHVTLILDGTGSVKMDGDYKNVTARLGGVGSIHMNGLNSDQIDLHLRGAGQISLNGRAHMLRATLTGVGSLDAQKMQADAVKLELRGLGSATVYAKNSAYLNLRGLGSAAVHGNPAQRQQSARGMGSVTWH